MVVPKVPYAFRWKNEKPETILMREETKIFACPICGHEAELYEDMDDIFLCTNHDCEYIFVPQEADFLDPT
jgi:hypothetical protein